LRTCSDSTNNIIRCEKDKDSARAVAQQSQ